MNEQDALPGTFHLKLNVSITRDYEDIQYFVNQCIQDPQMAHRYLKPARELLITTVNCFLPRKETIKNSLELLHQEFPRNINVLANLAHLYNSLLLTKKFEELQAQLTGLLADQSANGRLDQARALAEKGFLLIGDVASQEISDDVDKLKTAVKWLSAAIEDGKAYGMDNEEIVIWTFHLAKSRFRLENRYREEKYKEDEQSRRQNFSDLLDCFGQVYLFSKGKPDLAVYAAMSLVYAAEIFSLTPTHGLPDIPQLYFENPELQEYHKRPLDACMKAVQLYDCYAVRNRFARMVMNQHKFQDALQQVKRSLALNTANNWFGYCTRLQIYKNWYHSERKKRNVCKNMLNEALEGLSSFPYRSASMLLDIADIHYYLGVDPFTEKPEVPEELEKAIEYVMLARERVEGYKNARAHARLGHCLWAMGSQRPAIECMKRAVELEKPGYQKNIQNLCEYMLINYRSSVVGDAQSKIVQEAAAVFATGQEKLGNEEFQKLLLYISHKSLADVLRQILQHMFHTEEHKLLSENLFKHVFKNPINLEPGKQFSVIPKSFEWQQPKNCQSPGFQHDFFIFSAPEDYTVAVGVLEELESRHCEGYTTYKGSHKRSGHTVECFYVLKFFLSDAVWKNTKLVISTKHTLCFFIFLLPIFKSKCLYALLKTSVFIVNLF